MHVIQSKHWFIVIEMLSAGSSSDSLADHEAAPLPVRCFLLNETFYNWIATNLLHHYVRNFFATITLLNININDVIMSLFLIISLIGIADIWLLHAAAIHRLILYILILEDAAAAQATTPLIAGLAAAFEPPRQLIKSFPFSLLMVHLILLFTVLEILEQDGQEEVEED